MIDDKIQTAGLLSELLDRKTERDAELLKAQSKANIDAEGLSMLKTYFPYLVKQIGSRGSAGAAAPSSPAAPSHVAPRAAAAPEAAPTPDQEAGEIVLGRIARMTDEQIAALESAGFASAEEAAAFRRMRDSIHEASAAAASGAA
jgi:uncharacterized protein YgbK (DUF1537 family)